MRANRNPPPVTAMQQVIAFRVLIASPSDVPDARLAARSAIDDWNRRFSMDRSIVLLPAMWEDALPSDADRTPQEILNRKLVDISDICVGLFWSRTGTPTRNHPGGAVEEIHRMRKRGCPTMLYFSESPLPANVDLSQLRHLRSFRSRLQRSGASLATYGNLEQLRRAICDSLSHAVDRSLENLHPSSFVGTWLEVKHSHTQRPYALVEISAGVNGRYSVRGTSYTASGEACVKWPTGGLDLAVPLEDRLFHTYDAQHGNSNVVGVACYSVPSNQSPEYTIGRGYYAQQSSGDSLPSHRVDFDLVRVTKRQTRSFVGVDHLRSDAERSEFVRAMHVQILRPRVVLTGGPYAGKTTLIEALAALGFATIPEAAIEVIRKEAKERGRSKFEEWRDADPVAFQTQVFLRQLKNERRLGLAPPAKPGVFMDRSGIDSISYLRLAKRKVPTKWLDYAWANRFREVFVLDTLQPFEPRADTLRRSNLEVSLRLRDQLLKDYESFGYRPILIPQDSLDNRLRAIVQACPGASIPEPDRHPPVPPAPLGPASEGTEPEPPSTQAPPLE